MRKDYVDFGTLPVVPLEITLKDIIALLKQGIDLKGGEGWYLVKIHNGLPKMTGLEIKQDNFDKALLCANVHNQCAGLDKAEIAALYKKHCFTKEIKL